MLYLTADTELWFGRHEGEDIFLVLIRDFEYIVYCHHYLTNFRIDAEDVEHLGIALWTQNVYMKHLDDYDNLPKEKDLLNRLGITDWKNEFGEHDYIPDEVYEELNDNNFETNNYYFYHDDQPSYSKYNGYNDWDDDTIDSAFEGDPTNTWNVD